MAWRAWESGGLFSSMSGFGFAAWGAGGGGDFKLGAPGLGGGASIEGGGAFGVGLAGIGAAVAWGFARGIEASLARSPSLALGAVLGFAGGGGPLWRGGAALPVAAAGRERMAGGRRGLSQRPQYAEIAKLLNPQCGHLVCSAIGRSLRLA
jgi:hypothetical protein